MTIIQSLSVGIAFGSTLVGIFSGNILLSSRRTGPVTWIVVTHGISYNDARHGFTETLRDITDNEDLPHG